MNFAGKLLDHRTPDGYLADLPPSALSLATLVNAYHLATDGYKANTKGALGRCWVRMLSLMAEDGLVPPHLPKRFRREAGVPGYQRSPDCPTVEDAAQVINAAGDRPVGYVLYVCLTLGADRTEAALLDPREGLKGWVTLRGGKNAYRTDRRIPVPGCLARSLADRRPTAQPSTNNLVRALRGLGPDLPKVTFKGLRRTFTSIEHELGCPAAVRARIMGHSPNSISLAYQHPSDETVRLWLERWWTRVESAIVGQACGSDCGPNGGQNLGSSEPGGG